MPGPGETSANQNGETRKVVEESRYVNDLTMVLLAPEYSQVPTLLVTHKDAAPMSGIHTLLGLFKDDLPEWESAA